MAFTLWNLFEATILFLNAVCVLNEDRFLAKIGWGINSQNVQGFGEQSSMKFQILKLIWSIRTVARVTVFQWISHPSYGTCCSYIGVNMGIILSFRLIYENYRITDNFYYRQCVDYNNLFPLIFLNVLVIIIKLILG